MNIETMFCQTRRLNVRHVIAEKDAEIERLRETLHFYADPENYEPESIQNEWDRPIFDDMGQKAREALGED